jgi:hypothetical protein
MVIRLDAWLELHTSDWPTLSAWAVDKEGYELHLENAAADLGIDEANMRKAWRLGVRMGVWGNKPHPKAKPKDNYQGRRRLYRYGAIDLARAEQEAGNPEPDEATPESYEKVCTYLFGACIWKQIKDRPKEVIETWKTEQARENELAAALHADLMAGFRLFIAQREDTRWTSRGVKIIRQEHEFKNGHAAAHTARQGLVKELYAPKLLPLLTEAAEKRYVQTSQESVQTAENSLDTLTQKASTAGASLFPQRSLEEHRSLVRAGGSDAHSGPVKTPPVERESPPILLPEDKEPEPSEEERKALDLFFLKTREMQDCYPETRFGSVLVREENKGDMALARKVLAALGDPADMAGFMYQCAIDLETQPRSLGMLPRTKTPSPAKNPRDRFLGLFVEWAEDYRNAAPAREQEKIRRAANQVELEARQKVRAADQAYEEYAAAESARRLESMDAEVYAKLIKAHLPGVRKQWPQMSKDQQLEMARRVILGQQRPTREEWEQEVKR